MTPQLQQAFAAVLQGLGTLAQALSNLQAQLNVPPAPIPSLTNVKNLSMLVLKMAKTQPASPFVTEVETLCTQIQQL